MASRVRALPGLHLVSPSQALPVKRHALEESLACQRLAFQAAREIASLLRPGWTERQTAALFQEHLKGSGIKTFFHEAFVWFGSRARFDGIRRYGQYQATNRKLLPGDVFILDIAPIHHGYLCDIGFTGVLGENPAAAAALVFLKKLRAEIPELFETLGQGGLVWKAIDDRIREVGYDNIHARYPFSVLGHRLPHIAWEGPRLKFLNFGWQSYWGFLSRGLFGQLLNADHVGDLEGLWAVEPHIGWNGGGAKFEEILVIENGKARWLETENPWAVNPHV